MFIRTCMYKCTIMYFGQPRESAWKVTIVQSCVCATLLVHRASLVISETVDAGLLGELIVPTLRHAWRELLLLPRQPVTPTTNQTQGVGGPPGDMGGVAGGGGGGRVIPSGAVVYAVAIECSEVRRQSRCVCVCVRTCTLSYMYNVNVCNVLSTLTLYK